MKDRLWLALTDGLRAETTRSPEWYAVVAFQRAAIGAEAARQERERLRAKARDYHSKQHRSPPNPALWEDCRWQPCPDRRRLLAEPEETP